MRLIKNFMHNINDILLALVIVAVAAGIIFWRMDMILEYPKQMAARNAVYMQNDAYLEDDLDEAEDESAEEADEASGEDAEASEEEAEGAKG